MSNSLPARWAIVGRGRLGTALAAALARAGLFVGGPLGRDADCAGADAALLCVPDAEIAAAARHVGPGILLGHCSGAQPLKVVGEREAFGLHPLMTVTGPEARFADAGCAVAGTTPSARAAARRLAETLGMRPVEVDDADRAAYHAAASVASNFLVTLEAAAERLAATAGVDRDLLVPLVRATVENWAARGAAEALTGPIARGDEATVARQRDAVAARAPELLPLFDALAATTRELAGAAAAAHGERGSAMRTIRRAADLRAALAPARQAGRRIALVPTMGAFHQGHLELIRQARREAEVVVVSLFVNPAQFGPAEDLAGYPRHEARDAALAAAEGVDVLFAPPVEEVYPAGFATSVRVAGPLTERLEGASRGADHFHGVTTVVAKLLNLVGPDAAYFGRKDAQQALVIAHMVEDLGLPVEIFTCPTVREPDGLALSSRNAYLDPADRERAVALRRGLEAAAAAVAAGEIGPARVAAAGRTAMAEFGVEPEYFEIVNPTDLSSVAAIDGEALVAVAARVGKARLIDNELVRVPARVAAAPHEHRTRETACSA